MKSDSVECHPLFFSSPSLLPLFSSLPSLPPSLLLFLSSMHLLSSPPSFPPPPFSVSSLLPITTPASSPYTFLHLPPSSSSILTLFLFLSILFSSLDLRWCHSPRAPNPPPYHHLTPPTQCYCPGAGGRTTVHTSDTAAGSLPGDQRLFQQLHHCVSYE